MRLYYDAATGRPLYTLDTDPAKAPGGDWIEVAKSPDDLAACRVIDGALVVSDISILIENAVRAVNQAAGDIRTRFITDIPGQAEIYRAKEDEARAYLLQSPVPLDPAAFPLLAAEVGITAATEHDLAQLWVRMGADWRRIGAQLENLRMAAIARLRDASEPSGIDAALSEFAAALAAFSGSESQFNAS